MTDEEPDHTISETVSEKQDLDDLRARERPIVESVSEKQRRGRPPAFEPDFDAALLPVWSDRIATQRSLRNKQYMILGLRAIRPDSVEKINARHDWFAGSGKGQHRQAVLAELGRIAIQHNDATHPDADA